MTTYYILKSNGLLPDITVYQTKEFNKNELQKIFDETAKELPLGESVEYGKQDEKYFYPAMLMVEKTDTGLVRYTEKGYKVKYYPKY